VATFAAANDINVCTVELLGIGFFGQLVRGRRVAGHLVQFRIRDASNKMSEMSENMSYFAAFAAALEMLEEFVFRQKILSTNAALVLPFLLLPLPCHWTTREVIPTQILGGFARLMRGHEKVPADSEHCVRKRFA